MTTYTYGVTIADPDDIIPERWPALGNGRVEQPLTTEDQLAGALLTMLANGMKDRLPHWQFCMEVNLLATGRTPRGVRPHDRFTWDSDEGPHHPCVFVAIACDQVVWHYDDPDADVQVSATLTDHSRELSAHHLNGTPVAWTVRP